MMGLLFSSGLIAEVILYSEGFESSKNLAQKMTQMYKLCSEQLSQQVCV